MGLFDFVKDAGARLFGGDDKKKTAAAKGKAEDRSLEQARADREKGEALKKLVSGSGIEVRDFVLSFRDGKATLKGKVHAQADREKVVLMVGNVQGVGQVDDQLHVEATEPQAVMYTVKSGDTLSKIAKQHYGDAMKYPAIFEANKPMLKDPNKIYPGQVLRIPPLGK